MRAGDLGTNYRDRAMIAAGRLTAVFTEVLHKQNLLVETSGLVPVCRSVKSAACILACHASSSVIVPLLALELRDYGDPQRLLPW